MCEHGQTRTIYIADETEKANRFVASRKPVDVDLCIAALVARLNDYGMYTVASCCGHGYRPGNIALEDGRELIIARSYEEARKIDALFPLDIHGRLREEEPGGYA